MIRLSRRAAGAAALGACLACASRPPAASPAAREPSPTRPAAGVAFASPLEARATLLMLEDERRYDGAAIEAAAGHSDPRVRAGAAHAAGAIGDARGLTPLERLARDPDASVRRAAALGLEIGGFAEGSSAAAALLADPDRGVRCAAARGVAAVPGAAGETVLVEAIRSEPEACLLYALARFETERAAAAARDLAGSASPEIRRAAVYAFARSPRASSSAALAAALPAPDPEAARWAARALGILGDPIALPALSSALDRSEPLVRMFSAGAIGEIERRHAGTLSASAAAKLVALARDSNTNVALSALEALRGCGNDREAYRALHAQAVSGTGRRRIVAFRSEAAILGDRIRPRIEAAGSSPDVAWREAAASSLSFLSEGVAAALAPSFLKDGSPRVREAAVRTLSFDAAGRAALDVMLSDPDAGVRSAAIDRLAQSGDTSVLPELAAAFDASRDDPIPDAALSTVRAAERWKTDAGRALLEKAAASSRVLVARKASRALVEAFGADPAAHPLPTYSTGRTIDAYEAILAASEHPRRAIVRTPRGSFTIALDPASAPLGVANFEALARGKSFDGTAFDHVAPWYAGGGDPAQTLHGGPVSEIRDEVVEAPFEAGDVGIAPGGRDTGGSRWFVALSREPHMDGRFPRVGRVVRGKDVVERIEQGDGILSVTLAEGP